jgi:hypothetical protein
MTLSIVPVYANAECHYAGESFMLCVTNILIMPNVVMPSVIMLNVVAPIPSVAMLSVVLPRVVAPLE